MGTVSCLLSDMLGVGYVDPAGMTPLAEDGREGVMTLLPGWVSREGRRFVICYIHLGWFNSPPFALVYSDDAICCTFHAPICRGEIPSLSLRSHF